jgi:beta-glucuronidase
MMMKLLLLFIVCFVTCNGILYPKDSPSRLVKKLDGFWHFRIDNSPSRDEGFTNKWYSKPLQASGDTINMPVPSSYNDITQNSTIRDFIGWAWYDRNFWVPNSWFDKTRVVLRFEGANYYTYVWVNGNQAMSHEGGHLPFEADITQFLKQGQPNTVTVAVNNTLTPTTLPTGFITYYDSPKYPPGYFTFTGNFDSFNYAGIHRSVMLYTTPQTYINDITLSTRFNDDGSVDVDYTLDVGGNVNNLEYEVSLSGVKDSGSGNLKGTLKIPNPDLWWPWTMSSTPGTLNPFQVTITSDGISDSYRLAVGLRDITVTENQFLINGKPFYFNGVNMQEDWDTIGRGINEALLVKDINILKWLNVAAIKTSHYPYSEEFLDLLDKEGIVVIGESPAVGLVSAENMGNITLKHHINVMKDMIARDKNHPSIVMWSVANEPESSLPEAEAYFSAVVSSTRNFDPTRPVTFACNKDFSSDTISHLMDVIMLNRFTDWYENQGHPEVVPYSLWYDIWQWHGHYNKPIMISEYGASAITGIHENPSAEWSEEYQADALKAYWPEFDKYRKSFLIGELICTLTDYKTAQSKSCPSVIYSNISDHVP